LIPGLQTDCCSSGRTLRLSLKLHFTRVRML
jgi:hypothetical protein